MTTTQDFDWLSAYLDDQLPARDRAALEARLAAEPALRAALDDLRLTVRALRALPLVKPPRSFTLTPAQASGVRVAPRRGPLFPVLRFATALSAVALAVVVAGDLGGGFLTASVRQDATAGGEAEVALVTVTETVEEVIVPAEAPLPTATPVAEMDAMAGSGEGDAGADGTTEAMEAAEETPQVSMLAPEAAPSATSTGAADRTLAPTVEPSPKAAEPTPTLLVLAEAPPSATEDLFYSADDSAQTAQAAETESPGLAPLRLVEIGLITLTVLLGAAAWLTRRSN
jgi:hypothetical protein